MKESLEIAERLSTDGQYPEVEFESAYYPEMDSIEFAEQ